MALLFVGPVHTSAAQAQESIGSLLGQIDQARGAKDYATALTLADRVIAMDATVVWAHFFKAATLGDLKDPQAEGAWMTTAQLAPVVDVDYYALGVANARIGNWARSRELYTEAIARTGAKLPQSYGDRCLVNAKLDDLVAAKQDCAEAERVGRPTSVENVLVLADKLYKAGAIDDAFAQYEKVLARDPQNALAMYWRAKILVQSGDIRRAQPALDQYLLVVPGQPEASSMRAKLRFDRKDWAGTIIDAKAAIAHSPSIKLYTMLSQSQFELRQWQAAIESTTAAINLYGCGCFYHTRGSARLELNQRAAGRADYEQAIRAYEAEGQRAAAQKLRKWLRTNPR